MIVFIFIVVGIIEIVLLERDYSFFYEKRSLLVDTYTITRSEILN